MTTTMWKRFGRLSSWGSHGTAELSMAAISEGEEEEEEFASDLGRHDSGVSFGADSYDVPQSYSTRRKVPTMNSIVENGEHEEESSSPTCDDADDYDPDNHVCEDEEETSSPICDDEEDCDPRGQVYEDEEEKSSPTYNDEEDCDPGDQVYVDEEERSSPTYYDKGGYDPRWHERKKRINKLTARLTQYLDGSHMGPVTPKHQVSDVSSQQQHSFHDDEEALTTVDPSVKEEQEGQCLFPHIMDVTSSLSNLSDRLQQIKTKTTSTSATTGTSGSFSHLEKFRAKMKTYFVKRGDQARMSKDLRIKLWRRAFFLLGLVSILGFTMIPVMSKKTNRKSSVTPSAKGTQDTTNDHIPTTEIFATPTPTPSSMFPTKPNEVNDASTQSTPLDTPSSSEKGEFTLNPIYMECGLFATAYEHSQLGQGRLPEAVAQLLRLSDLAHECPCSQEQISVGDDETRVGGPMAQVCGSDDINVYKSYCRATFDSVQQKDTYLDMVFALAFADFGQTVSALEKVESQLMLAMRVDPCIEGCAIFVREACCGD